MNCISLDNGPTFFSYFRPGIDPFVRGTYILPSTEMVNN